MRVSKLEIERRQFLQRILDLEKYFEEIKK